MTRLVATLLALGVAACAATPSRAPGAAESVELTAVPFFAQDRYQCGPAALATVLGAAGVAVGPDELVPEVYLPARHGSLQFELLGAARRQGRVAYPLAPERSAVDAELGAGRPVLVLQNFATPEHPAYHYAVVIGYGPGYVLLRSGRTERLRLAAARFAGTWSRAGHWAFVALRPGELPASAVARSYLEAASAFEPVATPEDATEAYAAATQRWPAEPAAWLGLGNARTSAGDPAAAEAAFRRALAVAPGYAAARNNLAELLARRGCLRAARGEITRAEADAAGSAVATAVAATRQEIEVLAAHAGPAECPEP